MDFLITNPPNNPIPGAKNSPRLKVETILELQKMRYHSLMRLQPVSTVLPICRTLFMLM